MAIAPGGLAIRRRLTTCPTTRTDILDCKNHAQGEPTENELIGMAWAVLDCDNAASESHSFWNLSRQHTMYGKADELAAFKLMPLEARFRKFDANWRFQAIRHGPAGSGVQRRDHG
jgi:hypothetical protein